jgi:hypothetical protein
LRSAAVRGRFHPTAENVDEPVPAKRVPGDITSNFPFHLFDSPIPQWPTFGLDLADLRADRQENSPRTWIPTSNLGGIANLWTRLGTTKSIGNTLDAVFSMINAARNWMDNLQAAAPGYRDRIVHAFLNKREAA